MNKILIMLIAVVLISCNQNSESKSENKGTVVEINSETENFNWLLGKWKRNNEEEGKETYENWEKINSTQYEGIGFTMQNGDTVKQEKISIIKTKGKWDLLVKAPEDLKSIAFEIVEIKSNEFICTNDSLDFPKLIKYWKNGEKINALVAADDFEISFEFDRI